MLFTVMHGLVYMSVLTTNMVSRRNEFLVIAGLCMLGMILRTQQLGSGALNPDEMTGAMSAWRLITDGRAMESKSVMPVSALLHTLQMFTFWLGGNASAELARFWPAIAGSLFVLWPVLLRNWIGRDRVLVAVALQVVSPVLWIVSRTGDGMSLALICGLTMLAGWKKWRSRGLAPKICRCGWSARPKKGCGRLFLL